MRCGTFESHDGQKVDKSGRRFWPAMLSLEFPEEGNGGGGCSDGELSKEDSEESIMGASGEREKSIMGNSSGESEETMMGMSRGRERRASQDPGPACLFQQQGCQSCKAERRSGLGQTEGAELGPSRQYSWGSHHTFSGASASLTACLEISV